MRCSCHECGVYMAQSEGLELGCVCPACGYRCKACLGTDTVVSRDNLKNLQFDPKLMEEIFNDSEDAVDAPARETDEYLD